MNCEAAKLAEARRQEVEALGGLPAYRLQALQNLRLKTVVKASAWNKSEARSGRWGPHHPRLPPSAAACRRRSSDELVGQVGAAAQPAAQPSCCTPTRAGEPRDAGAGAGLQPLRPAAGQLVHHGGRGPGHRCGRSECHAAPRDDGLLRCGRPIHLHSIRAAVVLQHVALLTLNAWPSPHCTVAASSATVYDDEYMGDHVALVVHFTNAPSEHAPGGELSAAAWLSSEEWNKHPHGDACLAVAGADPTISGEQQGSYHALTSTTGHCQATSGDWACRVHVNASLSHPCLKHAVISVAEARVVKLLRGHTSEVVELCAAGAAAPRLLASLSRDGNLRLWDVAAEACLSSMQLPEASCLVRGLVVGFVLLCSRFAAEAAAHIGVRAGFELPCTLHWSLGLTAVCCSFCSSSLRSACPQATAPDGHSLLVGTRKGQLVQYDIVAAAGGAAASPPPAALGAAAAREQQQAAAAEQPERHQQTAAPPAAAEQQQKAAAAAAVCIGEGSRRELVLQGASHSDPIDCLVSWAAGWGLAPGDGAAGEHQRVMLAAPMPTSGSSSQTSAAFNCRIISACCCLPNAALPAWWPGGDQVQRWPHVRLALCQ